MECLEQSAGCHLSQRLQRSDSSRDRGMRALLGAERNRDASDVSRCHVSSYCDPTVARRFARTRQLGARDAGVFGFAE